MPKAEETKQQRGIRLANTRVPRAIKALQNVGALASYDLIPEHNAKITEAISVAYEAVLAKFQPKPKEKSFSL